jgi:hypothetical protein
MTETCDVCWAEVQRDFRPLHALWHQAHAKDEVPKTYTCDECGSVVSRDKELDHEQWHTYVERLCIQ